MFILGCLFATFVRVCVHRREMMCVDMGLCLCVLWLEKICQIKTTAETGCALGRSPRWYRAFPTQVSVLIVIWTNYGETLTQSVQTSHWIWKREKKTTTWVRFCAGDIEVACTNVIRWMYFVFWFLCSDHVRGLLFVYIVHSCKSSNENGLRLWFVTGNQPFQFTQKTSSSVQRPLVMIVSVLSS